jgi:hypothetical protein
LRRIASKVGFRSSSIYLYPAYIRALISILTDWIDDLKVTERFFTVPLDYANPDGAKIRVFARHIVPKAKAKTPEDEAKLPYGELDVAILR